MRRRPRSARKETIYDEILDDPNRDEPEYTSVSVRSPEPDRFDDDWSKLYCASRGSFLWLANIWSKRIQRAVGGGTWIIESREACIAIAKSMFSNPKSGYLFTVDVERSFVKSVKIDPSIQCVTELDLELP